MSVITKDLGAVTAYAAAVNRGYTGTKEEFETLMASYAIVAQQAAESAGNASQSATNAGQSATDAETAKDAAQQAATYAQTAQTLAQSASQSAQQSAQSASQSATDAESAKNTAVDAVDGFEAGAQQALDSVNQAGNNWKSLAEAQKLDSEAWAVGQRDGADVGVSDETYHNNAKYYATQASGSASSAATSESNASVSATNAATSETNAANSATAAQSAASTAADDTAASLTSQMESYVSSAAASATAAAASAASLTIDTEPTEGSTNGISSGAVYELKEDLENGLKSQSIYGFTTNAITFNNNTRLKTFPVYLRKGSFIDLSALSNVITYINGYTEQSNAFNSYKMSNGATNGDIVYTYPYRDNPTYTIKADGWYMIVAKNSDDSAFADLLTANNIIIYTQLDAEELQTSGYNTVGYYEINGYANGSFGGSGELSYGQTNRLRFGDFRFFRAGTTIKINSGTCKYGVGMWKNTLSADTIIRNDSSFKTGTETIVLEYDSYIVVVFAKQNTSENISKSDLDGYVRVYPFVAERIEDIQDDIQGLETNISGIESQISGVTGSFSQSDAFTIKESLPSYYSVLSGGSYNGYDVGYLESKIKTIPDGKHFIVRTDTHVPDNAKKSTKIIEYIRRRCGIAKVVDLGDWINRGETNVLGWAQCADYVQESVEMFGRDFDVVIGNHDLNSANISESDQSMVIPYDIAHNLFQSHLDGFVTYPLTSQIPAVIDTLATGDDLKSLKGLYKTFYYRDDAKNKIRYIVLYSGADYTVTYTYLNVMGNEVLCTQFDWLYDTLMSVPTGYDVVVFVHQMSGSYHYIQPIQQGCMKILSHFKTKTTYNLNYDRNDSPVYAQGIHSYNFANAPTVGKVLCCAGHIHYDQMLYVSANAYGVLDQTCDNTNGVIPIITTLTDSYGMHDYERNSSVFIEHDEPYYEMTSGAVTEQVVDVYTLNDSGIYITRFGAGVDRYLQML